MNKTAIKDFAVWARNKLISDISYKANLMGITDEGISDPLSQSTNDVQFFDVGTREPYSITVKEILQRQKLVDIIEHKAEQSNYQTAIDSVIEEVAYTWFNRLIAIRFMEVNDYLPSRIRVLSSESPGKTEPDLVTNPFDSDLNFTDTEKNFIVTLKQDNELDELFRFLFIKQCNALNTILPELFEKTNDYMELLLNISFTDKEGIVAHLVYDIEERDFKIRTDADDEAISRGEMTEGEAPAGQVEIIGWLYQYYNTEPKQEVFDGLKKNIKITKEKIPAATQLFTPDWIVRYMVENSLGRLWLERHPNDELKSKWKYYLEEAEQDPNVEEQLQELRVETPIDSPEDMTFIDPCMGSGHILVYAFDVLMQIYESCGYSQRDAALLIIRKNLFGLDIDKRAHQLTYFSVMMKARQYNRRALSEDNSEIMNVMCFQDAVDIDRQQVEQWNNKEFKELLAEFKDVDTYGSLLKIKGNYNLEGMLQAAQEGPQNQQIGLMEIPFEQIKKVINLTKILTNKYDVVCTNPPYMSSSGMNSILSQFVKKEYKDSKSDLFACFIERGLSLTKNNTYSCMVTMQSWMFLSSFEKLRKNILENYTITNLMHMENMVMGIAFGTAVSNLQNIHVRDYKGRYNHITMADIEDDHPIVFPPVSQRNTTACTENFAKIPGMPVAYWVSKKILEGFLGSKIKDLGFAGIGMRTGDNERFLRKWYEISIKSMGIDCTSAEETMQLQYKWIPYNKGGNFRRWYGNNEYVVNWFNDGKEIKENTRKTYPQLGDNLGWKISNEKYYFQRGITWTGVTSGDFNCRLYPSGFIFDSGANGLFAYQESNMFYLAGYLNTKIANSYLKIINPTINTGSGSLNSVPIKLNMAIKHKVDENVSNCYKIAITDWDSFETSWDFTRHPLRKFGISLPGYRESRQLHKVEIPHVKKIRTSDSFFMRMVDRENNYQMQASFEEYKKWTEAQFLQLKANEEELNRIFIDIYGLQDELTPEVADKDITVARIYDTKKDIPESMKGNRYVLTKEDVVKSFISYAVGCMFGRYSLDVDGLAYAGGDWDESKYSTFIPDKDNILLITDEEYYEDDIVGLFVAFVKKVYGAETLEENLNFIADALGGKGKSSREVIRDYFLKDFFKDHCRTYKKRPIYWLFDSGRTNGFKALIYMHRYDEDTIGNLRIDYLHQIQQVYTREISRMQETIDNSSNGREITAAEKRKEKLTKQLKETTDYDEKISHLALARTAIDLDDGVKVNYEKVQTDTEGNKLEVLAKIR